MVWGRFLAQAINLILLQKSRLSLGHTQPPSQWVIGGGEFLWGLQHLGGEADGSFASSAQVKNDWSYTSTLARGGAVG